MWQIAPFKDRIDTFVYDRSKKIRKIPKEIGEAINLKKIVLRENTISEISSSIGNLAALEYLDLNSNRIRKVPTFDW